MKVPVAEIVWRDDLYPRIEPDPATIQRYAADLTVLPPIEVNQRNELIDGYHRWTAHRKENAAEIEVTVTETASDVELLALACKRNSAHGLQLADKDKRSMAIRLYASGTGMEKKEIAETLSVSERTVNGYLADTDKQLREQRRETIRALWLACHTQQEIADAVGYASKSDISAELAECSKLEALPKSNKLAALHEDADWVPPLYDIWNVSSNLRPDAASYLRGCLVRMTPREKGGRPGENSSNNLTSLQAVADEAGVTRQTLHNDAAFAEAVDTLAATVGEEVRELATSGCIAAVLLLYRARPGGRRTGGGEPGGR